MLTKAWIAILMGLLLGSLLFSSGCGWWGGGYSNNPYYGQPCNSPVPQFSGTPASGIPAGSGTPGWRVPATSSSPGGASGAASSGSATATP
jgi:hypothetical protein